MRPWKCTGLINNNLLLLLQDKTSKSDFFFSTKQLEQYSFGKYHFNCSNLWFFFFVKSEVFRLLRFSPENAAALRQLYVTWWSTYWTCTVLLSHFLFLSTNHNVNTISNKPTTVTQPLVSLFLFQSPFTQTCCYRDSS